jgi:hypothetical protein
MNIDNKGKNKEFLKIKVNKMFLLKKINKSNAFLILFLFYLTLTIGFINAQDELQDFLDSVPITITITQNTSQVDFSLDTSNRGWDRQSISIKNQSVGDVYIYDIFLSFNISKLLNKINFEAEINKDSNTPKFNSLEIMGGDNHIDGVIKTSKVNLTYTDASTKNFLNLLFSSIDPELNITNVSSVNAFLANNPLPEKSPSHITFTKQGTSYRIWNDRGYGDLPEEWKSEIRNIINESVQQINIKNILENMLPVLETRTEFQNIWGDLNLDFNVTDIDLSPLDLNASFSNLTNIKLEDGNYTIRITVSDGLKNYTKNVLLIFKGIKNTESGVFVPDGNFTPTNPEVAYYIIGISGLGNNTVSVTLFDVFDSALPSNIKSVIKYIEINVSKETSGIIKFKVPTNKVVNPSLVSLYVLEGSNWVKLPTTFLSTSLGFYEFQATTPHFSIFMIAEENQIIASGGGFARGSSRIITQEQTPTESTQQPTNEVPTPIVPTPPQERTGGGIAAITGAIIGAITSPTGLFSILVVLIAVIVIALVIRNVGPLSKKDQLNDKRGENDK